MQANSSQHKPTQFVDPLFCQPAAQLPHVLLPAVLIHCRFMWQPPFIEVHSLISNKTIICVCFRGKNRHQKMCQNLSMYITIQTDLSRPIHLMKQTFAARGSIVGPTRWTVAACSAPSGVRASTFGVTSAIACQTLVHV